jgi:hypothetical protein
MGRPGGYRQGQIDPKESTRVTAEPVVDSSELTLQRSDLSSQHFKGISWSIASGVEPAMSVEAGLQSVSAVWHLESIEGQQVDTPIRDTVWPPPLPNPFSDMSYGP